MASFFLIRPDNMEVVTGSKSQFSFSLIYDVQEKRWINQPSDLVLEDFPTLSELSDPSACRKKRGIACFYIVFSYGSGSDNIGRIEDVKRACFSIKGEESAGWRIQPAFNKVPYWVLWPVAEEGKESSGKRALEIDVDRLWINNQEGSTLMEIKPFYSSEAWDETDLLIHKTDWISVPNVAVSKSGDWNAKESICIQVKGNQQAIRNTSFFIQDTDAQKWTDIEPDVPKELDFSVLEKRSVYLVAQDQVIEKKLIYQFPFFSYRLEGGKEMFSRSWTMCSAEGYGGYTLDGTPVSSEGKDTCLVKAENFSSVLEAVYTGAAQKQTKFQYQLAKMPIPEICSFEVSEVKFLNTALANGEFMAPELLEQPGIVLQVAPYEPFIPDPPQKKRKVKVIWRVKNADLITINGQKVDGDEGSQIFETAESVMTIRAKLDNGFFKEQTREIEGGS